LSILRRHWWLPTFLSGVLACGALHAEQPATNAILAPLIASKFQTLPSNHQVQQYLAQVAQDSPVLTLEQLGRSAGKRWISTVIASKDPQFATSSEPRTDDKLTVLLIGSQHGSEPSGTEGLLWLIQKIAQGEADALLQHLHLIILPLANPDGRDNDLSRYNENMVDINRDFLLALQPETRLIIDLMNKYQPDVLLDIHEASAYKKILGGEQGYLTNFEAQLAVSNHPNVDSRIRDFTNQLLLPELVQRIKNNGLYAQQYRGSVKSLNQPFLQASLHGNRLRNYAGLRGIIAVLLENKLDLPKDEYPTPHNIRERATKQLLSTEAFLKTVIDYRTPILEIRQGIRNRWQSDDMQQQILQMVADFTLDKNEAVVDIPLIQLATNSDVIRPFVNFSAVDVSVPYRLPEAYVVTREQALIAEILDRHHLDYQVADQAMQYSGAEQKITTINLQESIDKGQKSNVYVELAQQQAPVDLAKGDLLVKTNQPNGILIPIMFDPRSYSSIFQELTHRPLLLKYRDFFILPVKLKTEQTMEVVEETLVAEPEFAADGDEDDDYL
jgi:Zinc carboxypeptidase